jgi:hypothetical protein
MTCQECTLAESDPCSAIYRIACPECEARQLAHGIEHARSRDARKMTAAYAAQLRAVFGDGWEAGHQRVKAWAMRIDAARMAKVVNSEKVGVA